MIDEMETNWRIKETKDTSLSPSAFNGDLEWCQRGGIAEVKAAKSRHLQWEV